MFSVKFRFREKKRGNVQLSMIEIKEFGPKTNT